MKIEIEIDESYITELVSQEIAKRLVVVNWAVEQAIILLEQIKEGKELCL